MDVNPYESPRTEKPFSEGTLPGGDSIRQLLMEIRDAQRERLQLQRDALLRQQKTVRSSYMFMVIPFIVIALSLYFSFSSINRMRRAPPIPATPAPRVFPPVAPQPIPKPASLQHQ
jgi:hypothetical protein